MLKLIYGPPGSGKTFRSDELLLKDLQNGKKVYLLVPEQEAIETENRIYDKAEEADIGIEKLAVVSFRRLANTVFRKHGGIVYDNIGDGGRLVLMWRCIEELAANGQLVYFTNRDRSLVELMLSVCEELKRYCVSGTSLANTCDKITDSVFKNKLHDISMIYTYYMALMKDKYSDSLSDVDRLADILITEKLDSNDIYYVDSFNGFTEPEIRVLRALIRSCDVVLTVNRYADSGRTGFMTVEATEKELLDYARDNSVKVETVTTLSDGNTFTSPEFKLIKEKLYDYSFKSDEEFGSENVRLTPCKDAFAEAEYIAINICKLVRNGARYRDFAIISRNVEKFEGVLDIIFEKYGIPLFLSKRYSLTKTSLYRAITSALDVISDGYHTEDIISYIKSGVVSVSDEDIDLLEKYVYLWNIDGARWKDEEDWCMNPKGFTDRKLSNEAEVLNRINSIRTDVISPLTELAEALKKSTVLDACKALYRFLNESGIISHYQNTEDSTEITVYNAFIKLLDTLAKIAGDIPCNSKVLSSLLYMMAKNTDYGRIPASFDRVTAGDASIIRCNGIKHVFLADCESGVFPAAVGDDSFFSEKEKDELLKFKIKLSPNISEKNDLEAFYFLRSAGGASQTLTATFCLKGGKEYPSIGFQRLAALFPASKRDTYPTANEVVDRFQSLSTAPEILAALSGTDYSDILEKASKDLNINLEISDEPISNPSAYLSKETADALFEKGINMTYSRLENYVKCPFSFFCNDVLKLSPQKYSFFMANDMGSYIHKILELAINDLFKDKNGADITSSDVEKSIDSALKNVITGILGTADASTEGKRFEALILRLRRTLDLLVNNITSEFQKSLFKPKFFELSIGEKQTDVTPLRFTLDDGTVISVYGTIDRVDTYTDNKNVYVRVVDYKSGSTPHSVSNLKYGLDAQMLIYLFSIWKTDKDKFKKLLGHTEEINSIIPAGVLYQPSKLKTIDTPKPITQADALKTANKSLKRSGILIDDVNVLEAMELGLKGEFIPVTKSESKKGTTIKSTSLTSLDGFSELLEVIEDTFTKKGQALRLGNACATPLKLASHDACKWCSFASVCRSKSLNDHAIPENKTGGNE